MMVGQLRDKFLKCPASEPVAAQWFVVRCGTVGHAGQPIRPI